MSTYTDQLDIFDILDADAEYEALTRATDTDAILDADTVSIDGYASVREITSPAALKQALAHIESMEFTCDWWPADRNPAFPWTLWLTRATADEQQFVQIADDDDVAWVRAQVAE